MDAMPALLATQPCLQDGQLVRFFGRAAPGHAPGLLRIEDLLYGAGRAVDVCPADGCATPEMAAIVRATGPWRQDGTVEAYEIEEIRDAETLHSLQNTERLQLLAGQYRRAYKIARARMRVRVRVQAENSTD